MYLKSLDEGAPSARRAANIVVAVVLFLAIAAPSLALGLRLVS